MSDPIDSYLRSLRRELGTIPDADDMVAEIEDHLRESCSSDAPDADPALAIESAIERLGAPTVVARGIRMERGRLRGSDPIPACGWAFTLTEVMLILAATAYGFATWLYDQPCSADFDELGPAEQACLDRWEAAELLPFPALPFGFDGMTPSPATHLLFLVAVLLMTGSLALFVPRQPWFASIRRTALAVGVLTLVTGAGVAVHLGDPSPGLPWWATVAAVGVDLACVCATAQVWTDPPDLGHRFGSAGRWPPRPITFTRYRARAALVMLAAGGAGGLHLLQLLILGPLAAATNGVIRWLDAEWSLPTWLPYQAHTAAIAVPAILSLLLGRFTGRPQGFDASTEPIADTNLLEIGNAG